MDTAPVAPDLTLFDVLIKFRDIPDQEPMEWTEGAGTAVAFIGDNSSVVGWINGDLVVNDFYLPFVQKLQRLLFYCWSDGTIRPAADTKSWSQHAYR